MRPSSLPPSPPGSRPSPAHPAAALTLALTLALVGCGRSAVDAALEPEARGYLCSACTNRFRTDAEVFADACPRCGSVELLEVVGLVCPKDGTATLAPRGRFAVPCRQCGGPTSGLRLPTAADLDAWGAPLRTRADVSATSKSP